MGIIDTITETLRASSSAANRGDAGAESKGAYWCHDCDERLLDLDAETEGDGSPACPSCGEAMTFERSPGSTGCAC
jgi:DNA-directed RNA polymerase subunit RPC12/RpoP